MCKNVWFIFSLWILYSCVAAIDVNKDVVLSNVDRVIDITSQVVKISSKITIQANGSSPISSFVYIPDPAAPGIFAYLSANTGSGKDLEVVKQKVNEKLNFVINLAKPLKSGQQVTVNVDSVYTHGLEPYPKSITQKQKQLMLYAGNVYLYTPYTVLKQTTKIELGTRNIESFTKTKSYSQTDTNIQYGPYLMIQPYSSSEISVHYENNSPFLTVVNLVRILELSHWGNIAVQEEVHLEHHGAALKGSFSRFTYQRDSQSGLSSVKSFKTVLPASAQDVYYRDDIGNISTSNLRVLSDSSELDLRPRFPIFGGWRTKYFIGYNVPSYEYLYYSGSQFLLKMRLLDHIFDEMVVDRLVTKIVLPEGSTDIEFVAPYPVKRHADEKLYTYLDTTGRPVVVVEADNLVENHIQDFQIRYNFPHMLMLQEPIILSIGIFLLFLVGIIFVRLDFTISPEEKKNN